MYFRLIVVSCYPIIFFIIFIYVSNTTVISLIEMEEIDSIIIDTLRNLHCDIEDYIYNLKQFDAEMVTSAVSHCLQAISPDSDFPKKLPPSMSLKLKVASNLAEHVKDIGFRGDIGYQTILYCNEAELRRLFMFLIEKLPRDLHKTVEVEETGSVPRLMKEVEKKVRTALNQLWLPSNLLNNGTRPTDDGYIVNSLGNSSPAIAQRLRCLSHKDKFADDEAAKHYWIHIVPEVTKQCPQKQLLPSLLFGNEQIKSDYFKHILSRSLEKRSDEPVVSVKMNVNLENGNGPFKVQPEEKGMKVEESPTRLRIQDLLAEIEEEEKKYDQLKEEVRKYELQFSQLVSTKEKEEDTLKNTLSKIKVKTKTLLVASKEENKLKLKELIENGNDRLVELASQWNEVQTPLLEEYKTLQSSLSLRELKQQQNQARLDNLKQTHKELVSDLKEKELLEETLVKKCQQISKTTSRSAYTRRIMEIIGNIKKQDIEIQKVLKDTKGLQKEINNLTGQVDRSFTLCDELIFRDAKYDETARRAYKLLVALRNECGEIIKAITEIGVIEREIRNIQDQIEMESAKEIPKKLERVLSDLEEVKNESAKLIAQRKQ